MSRLTTGISGAIALILISGAAQFALGGDLALAPVYGRVSPNQPPVSPGSSADVSSVNRASKADRKMGPSVAPAVTRTVSLKLSAFSDTTFLLRVPMPMIASAPATSSTAKSMAHKPVVACESVVSMLTDVAKQLQPGRCVT